MTTTDERDLLRETLIEALWEAHEGAVTDEDRWSMEDIADDILASAKGRDLRTELERGQKAQAAIRLVVMRHHEGPYDFATCDVCSAAIRGLGE